MLRCSSPVRHTPRPSPHQRPVFQPFAQGRLHRPEFSTARRSGGTQLADTPAGGRGGCGTSPPACAFFLVIGSMSRSNMSLVPHQQLRCGTSRTCPPCRPAAGDWPEWGGLDDPRTPSLAGRTATGLSAQFHDPDRPAGLDLIQDRRPAAMLFPATPEPLRPVQRSQIDGPYVVAVATTRRPLPRGAARLAAQSSCVPAIMIRSYRSAMQRLQPGSELALGSARRCITAPLRPSATRRLRTSVSWADNRRAGSAFISRLRRRSAWRRSSRSASSPSLPA